MKLLIYWAGDWKSMNKIKTFAEVILPLPLRGTFTYLVPDHLEGRIIKGCRVEVQFGRSRFYSGLVHSLHNNEPRDIKIKEIIELIDEQPLVEDFHLKFWEWIANYYACSLGEVMNAALPSAMKLNSRSNLVPGFAIYEEHTDLTDDEFLLWEALQTNGEFSLDAARNILGKKHIAKPLETLLYKGIAELKEELVDKYKPVKQIHLKLKEEFQKDPGKAFKLTEKSEYQTNILLALLQQKDKPVLRSSLLANPEMKDHALKALIKKNIVDSFEKEMSRLKEENKEFEQSFQLSEMQKGAFDKMDTEWKENKVVLLHGVTGSGKTVLYREAIEETLNAGGQVLYLLPEIALTTQVIQRIEKILQAPVHLYHSRENIQKRVEIWNAAGKHIQVVMGARSAVFLPFHNLKLIIVDEEHDSSYKQRDPAPRYNARDAAVYLAHLTDARVVLGTATPSLESLYNAKSGKYGYVQLDERYGDANMPELEVIDIKECKKKKKMKGPFSDYLLEGIKEMWESGQQVILFQNRRGFAPTVQCEVCSWTYECHQCDVSMTYHKRMHEMKCHYCSHTTKIPEECPACGSVRLGFLGFGTEKIEEELELLLPGIKIDRMDSDSTRSKRALEQLLYNFENRKINVLIGTQMITKGLDFDNVGLVGIMNADQILNFPDFRSSERGFQLMTQVSGRAGRGAKKGRVVIQTSNPTHPVIKDVLNFNYKNFYYREIKERGKYHYPPFYRNFNLEIKHKDLNTLWKAARILKNQLSKEFSNRILGPTEPMVPRVRNYFILELMIKVEKEAELLARIKHRLFALLDHLCSLNEYKNLRFKLDVDPY
nr:primosomal protein N' [Saprospiraceae bacterium]